MFLVERIRAAMERLNKDVPASGFEEAIMELTRDRSRMNPAAANREVSELVKDGVKVTIHDDEEETFVVRVMDWERPESNDFLVVSQFWISGDMHRRRPDLIGFVNGIPLVFIELKATHRRLEHGYRDNLRDYKDTIPQVFVPNGFIMLSNGSETRVGSLTAGWEHFAEWKKVAEESEPGRVSLETAIIGTMEKGRLLDIIENFTLFQEMRGGLIKLVAKNHQYLGVNNAIQALQAGEDPRRLGVFWHTQGSGKSVSMVLFAQKVLRKVPGNWTFVLVTDRMELDDQIYYNFQSMGVIGEGHVQADSSRALRQLLRTDHRYVFTLIHKFRTDNGEPHPVLSDRSDVIVMTDEAHRSQYDTLALNMRHALPNARYLAFTGTPLIKGQEERTREVFGEYVSTYSFKQSVDDRATVPLYYENRIPEVNIVNDRLNEDMWDVIEGCELGEQGEQRLERELGRQYHLITRDDRLESIAKDLVEHFPARGFHGKGMVVCIDKATAVRMYDKVQAHWNRAIRDLSLAVQKASGAEQEALRARLEWMKTTDMAVVVSQGQNEVDDMAARGLDIRPHRRRMEKEDLETKFKDPHNPLRLVFVCAMWMTGFDVPSCSTIYLDKPMRNHTLMQTIARANRVYPGKESGTIVDYVGVFGNLEKALAIYGGSMPGDGGSPVEGKEALVGQLMQATEDAARFCTSHEVDLEAINAAAGFDKVALLDHARDALVANDAIEAEFLSHARYVNRLFKAVLPDASAGRFAGTAGAMAVLADKIRNLEGPVDIGDAMADIERVLDRSISAAGYVIDVPTGPDALEHLVDLSVIDFDRLQSLFEQHPGSTTQAVRAAIERRLQAMVERNRSRTDFLEKFQQMVADYNAGNVNQEEFFRQLREFTASLDEEEERHVREGLDEEQLAIYDLLTRPEPELTDAERDEVKAAARSLLDRLKEEKLVLDWRKTQQARSDVKVTIKEVLNDTLPEAPYDRQVFTTKCDLVFQHVFDTYIEPSAAPA